MDNNLKQVIYLSRQRLESFWDGGGEAILDILSLSRRNNPANGITGALLCSQGHFAQLIEGPSAAIDTLLARLKQDPRHEYMMIMQQRSVTQRAFENWSMALVDDDGLSALVLEPPAHFTEEGVKAVALLRYLVKEPEKCS